MTFEGLTFSEEDILDRQRLEEMITEEAIRIHNSDEARNGRSLETIKERVRQGKVAELYLIENFGYEEADIIWHDLKDSEGDYTEVKAYSNIWDEHAPQVNKDLKRYRAVEKFKSKWYLLFSVDDRNIYKFISKIRIK
jgi:hypothetical protein